jgi:O-antigen/teichoic acid export membrane protein
LIGHGGAESGDPAAGASGEPERLAATDIHDRAAGGAALLVVRGVAIRALGFVGNIVLAGFLVPADFGEVAVGSAVIAFVSLAADGGLGAALIRGDHDPSRLVFEQLLGLELGLAVAVTAVAAGLAPHFGRPGTVVAIMVASLCVAVFGIASVIHLERNLMFRRLATIDVASSIAFMACGIPAAALGAGVWALVSANLVQVLVTTGLYIALAPTRVLRPRLGTSALRPLLSFGARFQAIGVVNLIRDQGLNIGVAAVSGVSTLGVWSVAFRFIQVPFLLFESLWRVTFPGMARLLEAGEDPRPTVERMLVVSSVATAVIVCPLVGCTPALVPAVFAAKWHGIVDILPWACGGLLVGGPISVAVAGFLFAHGDASTVLRGAILHTAGSLLVGLALLPVLGVTALGMSVFASALIEGAVLGREAAHRFGVRIVAPLLVPTLCSIPAAGVGWWVANKIHPLAAATVTSAALALASYLALQSILDRGAVSATVHLLKRSIRVALNPNAREPA